MPDDRPPLGERVVELRAQRDHGLSDRKPELAQGRVPTGAARVLAAWVCHLRGQGAPVADVAAAEFTALAAGDLDEAVGRVLARLGADDARLHATVTALARELAANTGATAGNRLPT